MKAHLIGGGLAAMAAAVYLIRDAGLRGADITIYEASDRLGGSLGLAGSPEGAIVYPGGRVFERQYRCALELFDLIPSRTDPGRSIKGDIEFFNDHYGWRNACRLIDRDGAIVDATRLGLGLRHQLALARLLLLPERMIDGKAVSDLVPPSFPETTFWYIWSSIMAFHPEHSGVEMRRYLRRFLHILPQLGTMEFVLRTRHHQYQSLVEPIEAWLAERGVARRTGTVVEKVALDPDAARLTATSLRIRAGEATETVPVAPEDFVAVTNGSQLAGMSVGTMDRPAPEQPARPAASMAVWRDLCVRRPGLGDADVYSEPGASTTWMTFTIHTRSAAWMKRLEDLTGREAGRSGLVTFRDSAWLMTFTRFHDPNLIDLDPDVHTMWGYGIYPERPGDFADKPMTACTGREILTELLGHLHMSDLAGAVAEESTCSPCRLPHAGSVIVNRRIADRPPVVPPGSTNLAFIGQFCEQPEDVVFTMEYSVRSARTAVHRLTGAGDPPPPVFQGLYRPAVLLRVLRALMR